MWNKIKYALKMFWQRTVDCLSDPIRRRHLVGQIVVCWLSTYLVTLSWKKATVATAINFSLYEFVGEPIARWLGTPSWFGPYWERGPRTGEVFIRP